MDRKHTHKKKSRSFPLDSLFLLFFRSKSYRTGTIKLIVFHMLLLYESLCDRQATFSGSKLAFQEKETIENLGVKRIRQLFFLLCGVLYFLFYCNYFTAFLLCIFKLNFLIFNCFLTSSPVPFFSFFFFFTEFPFSTYSCLLFLLPLFQSVQLIVTAVMKLTVIA